MGSWGAGEGNRESLTCVHRVKVGGHTPGDRPVDRWVEKPDPGSW